MALNDVPPTVLARRIGCALVHNLRHAVGERPVHDVGVTRHPSDVRGAPVDVVVGLEIEDVPMGEGRLGQIPAAGVQDSFRLTRCPRRIEDEERMLGVVRLGCVVG